MKILLCHNHYQQPGGEDESFADEAWLLESRGHDVLTYTVHNDSIATMGRLELARKTIWNGEAFAAVRAILRRERPDVMHCTNTFPLLSPAIYYAARDEGVPVVQALRNYRLLCPNALFLRDGAVCEDCLGKRFAWPAVKHGCYRDSRAASAVVAGMLGLHAWWRTFEHVRLFYTLTEFARGRFIAGGFPAERIAVKPNFIPTDRGPGTGAGGYVVFVGRLSEEKGIETLLSAWSRVSGPTELHIVGDGPLSGRVQAAAAADPRIRWLGRRSSDEVDAIVADALALVLPSICYETFGRTIVEAYVRGTPVIASDLGAMAELVGHERTGLVFPPGDAAALAEQVERLRRDDGFRASLRLAARDEYERRFTPATNYELLLGIYRRAQGTEGTARSAESLASLPSLSSLRTSP